MVFKLAETSSLKLRGITRVMHRTIKSVCVYMCLCVVCIFSTLMLCQPKLTDANRLRPPTDIL